MKAFSASNFLVCLFLFIAQTVVGQSEKATAEDIFKKYLATEDQSVAEQLLSPEDGTYSLFAKALFTEDADEAIDFYTQFIAKKAEYGLGDAYFNRGILYHLMDSMKAAISDFDKAAELGIKDPFLYYFRGLSYASINETDKAIESLSTSLKINSEFGLAYLMRGTNYYVKKDYAKALSDLDKAVEFDNEDENAYLMRGVTYEEMGNLPKALENFEAAKKLDGIFSESVDILIERVKNKMNEKKNE